MMFSQGYSAGTVMKMGDTVTGSGSTSVSFLLPTSSKYSVQVKIIGGTVYGDHSCTGCSDGACIGACASAGATYASFSTRRATVILPETYPARGLLELSVSASSDWRLEIGQFMRLQSSVEVPFTTTVGKPEIGHHDVATPSCQSPT
jgi:hypothetical protein